MNTKTRKRLLKTALPIAAVAALGFAGTMMALPAYADEAPKQVKPMDVTSGGDDRIVGGAPVEEDKPWISALHNGGSFTCSSSQIGAEWVITAAHCV
ncbi:MAG: trypsin-like serine protease, partial [Stackebrandtia sp.]